MNRTKLVCLVQSLKLWLRKHHFGLVVLLALSHLGLAYDHARDLGGVDSAFRLLVPSICSNGVSGAT
jgi:hypothetical protein